MVNNLVFTLTSPAGGGKDTCAYMIREYCESLGLKVLMISYADYLKMICARNFGYDGSNKEEGRKILQWFGTDVVKSIERDFWVRIVFQTFDLLNEEYDVFIVADARFEEELQPYPYKLLYPIVNVYIDRKIETALGDDEYNHSSESMANNPDLNNFHYVIDNNDTLEYTYEQIENMVENVILLQSKLLDEQRSLLYDDDDDDGLDEEISFDDLEMSDIDD